MRLHYVVSVAVTVLKGVGRFFVLFSGVILAGHLAWSWYGWYLHDGLMDARVPDPVLAHVVFDDVDAGGETTGRAQFSWPQWHPERGAAWLTLMTVSEAEGEQLRAGRPALPEGVVRVQVCHSQVEPDGLGELGMDGPRFSEWVDVDLDPLAANGLVHLGAVEPHVLRRCEVDLIFSDTRRPTSWEPLVVRVLTAYPGNNATNQHLRAALRNVVTLLGTCSLAVLIGLGLRS